jgi:dihydroneopterin aldolase
MGMPASNDWIHLREFCFDCVLGIYEHERQHGQRLAVELSMRLDLSRAADGDVSRSVHYGEVLEQVQFIAQRGHWLLLESMAHALACRLLSPPLPGEQRAQIEEVVLRLAKPDVLGGRALPSIEIRREAAWLTSKPAVSLSDDTRIVPLHETAESGAYHVFVASGKTWTVPRGAAAMAIAGKVVVADRSDEAGAIAHAGAGCRAVAGDVVLLVASQRPLSREGWK